MPAAPEGTHLQFVLLGGVGSVFGQHAARQVVPAYPLVGFVAALARLEHFLIVRRGKARGSEEFEEVAITQVAQGRTFVFGHQ